MLELYLLLQLNDMRLKVNLRTGGRNMRHAKVGFYRDTDQYNIHYLNTGILADLEDYKRAKS